MTIFESLLIIYDSGVFFKASLAVSIIGLSLKPNYHTKVLLRPVADPIKQRILPFFAGKLACLLHIAKINL